MGISIVTGAGSGIGRALATELSGMGRTTVAISRNEDNLRTLASEVSNTSLVTLQVDVSNESEVLDAFAKADDLGKLDALVCCAGILHKQPFPDLTREDFLRTLEVNLLGTFLCCREAFTRMSQQGKGRIINLSSLSGVYATEKFPGLSAYNASKFGVVGLTEAIAVEGRDVGVSAICISPGAVDTPMMREANPDLKARLSPQEMARIIVALLDDDLAPLSGANIPIFSNQ